MITISIMIVIGYLLGSLSSAIIICKIMGLADPRTEGSMNPGATNVLRIGGKFPAALALLGDVLKGLIPVLIARLLHLNDFALGLVALAAFAGHLYPVFFKFQGGKGVATFIGTLLALSPTIGLAMLICWLIVAVLFRYSSLAALVASALTPLFAIFFNHYGLFLPLIAMVLLIFWKHKANIQRLLDGTETKINLSKK